MTRLRTTTLPLLIVLLSASALATIAESLPADGARITRVTVYVDRAEIERSATVALPAGASSVAFADVPFGVDADTLRVTARGVPAILGAVQLTERVEEPVETPEWIAAEATVDRLERGLAELRAHDAADQYLSDFLKKLGQVTATNQARAIAEGKADAAAVSQVYELMETKLHRIAGLRLEYLDQIEEIEEQLEIARAKLDVLRPAGSLRSRVATVEVETERAGELTLSLTYLAPGASWRPSYRATLDADGKNVEFVAEGVVRQNTGEDWSDVELSLSTAAPARGVEPPRLPPWVVRPPIEMLEQVRVTARRAPPAEPESDEAKFYQNVLSMAPGAQDVDAEVHDVAVTRAGYNVTFGVPGASTIEADGTDHRVVLRRESLAAKSVHRTVPALAPRAYLTAVTTSPAAYPLLAGPVRVFTGGAYLGSYGIEETAPGVELTLPFGIDNRVEVVRVPEPKEKSREGWTNKSKQVAKLERTILHNHTEETVTLVLEDRIPVAEDERIEIKLDDDGTTPGYQDSERRPGVKLWTLELAPNEKREVTLAYTVRYPRDMTLPDLE